MARRTDSRRRTVNKTREIRASVKEGTALYDPGRPKARSFECALGRILTTVSLLDALCAALKKGRFNTAAVKAVFDATGYSLSATQMKKLRKAVADGYLKKALLCICAEYGEGARKNRPNYKTKGIARIAW